MATPTRLAVLLQSRRPLAPGSPLSAPLTPGVGPPSLTRRASAVPSPGWGNRVHAATPRPAIARMLAATAAFRYHDLIARDRIGSVFDEPFGQTKAKRSYRARGFRLSTQSPGIVPSIR